MKTVNSYYSGLRDADAGSLIVDYGTGFEAVCSGGVGTGSNVPICVSAHGEIADTAVIKMVKKFGICGCGCVINSGCAAISGIKGPRQVVIAIRDVSIIDGRFQVTVHLS